MPIEYLALRGSASMSKPQMLAAPLVLLTSPARMLISVDLPAPLDFLLTGALTLNWNLAVRTRAVGTSHIFRPLRMQRGLAIAALLIAPVAASPALAQVGAQSEAEAIVLRPLSFFKVNDLDFGDIIPSNAAGTVTIEPGFTRDVRGIGHFGTGDLEITIQSMGDLDKAKPLFDAAYQNS